MLPKKFGSGQFSILQAFLSLGIGGLFTALAIKVAFTRQFPLPFDEGFHYGLIKLYAQHLNPFLADQQSSANAYGAVARDPSYLYHYLMSFPYRLVALITPSETAHIITLRCLNIGLGLTTLYLVYRLARRVGVSSIGASLVSLALAVTPVFYDLAAQINYDNLLIPLTLLTVLLALMFSERFKNQQFSLTHVTLFLCLITLTTLVKYSFLPIALIIVLFVAVSALRAFKGQLRVTLVSSFGHIQLAAKVSLIALVVLSGGLWVQRYGVNIARYGTPHPQCHVVLSVADCSQYGPWARNYELYQTRADRPIQGNDIRTFSMFWLRDMYLQVFATVRSGPTSVIYNLKTMDRVIAKVVLAGAAVCALLSLRVFARQRTTWLLFGIVGVGYLATLWTQNFSDYHNLHAYVAIQGRYLLLVLPLLYIAVMTSYEQFAERLLNFELVKLQASISNLLVGGWLGLRTLRRVGQLAVERVMSVNFSFITDSAEVTESLLTEDPWLPPGLFAAR